MPYPNSDANVRLSLPLRHADGYANSHSYACSDAYVRLRVPVPDSAQRHANAVPITYAATQVVSLA